ncbi:ATP-binding protein [Sporomusa malonica]|uniref:histidine kinase n=1 Tax=Sporomusa malonica TaxID=112901 RepID=A0A1W2DQS3_9FIRM|nr:ATP-binding protein [Sporomusa malonica]SMC99386.1 Signal transduction histidine kinase regulating C4-dicarboxylate transport system [Sporomusa malonica]
MKKTSCFREFLTIRNTISIIVLFGIFLLSVIWIGLHYKVQSERQLTISDAFKDTANFARAFEEHTLRTIKGADQAVLFLKYQYEQEAQTINIPQYIREGRLTNQPFVLLSVMDEAGDLVVSSQVPFVASNLKDREHFKVHEENDSGQLFISKPVLGRSSGKWSIQMTRRVNKPDGSFGGVVVVSVDPFYFTGFYKQVDLGKGSTITLVGKDGIVRARESGITSDVGQDMSQSALMEHLAVRGSGNYVSTSTIDGVKRIYGYRALNDYPFVVLVGISEEEVFRELNQRVSSYYQVAGLTTTVIGIFIIMLLFITVRQRRTAEALKQAHDNLELKVELRTQELFVANKELTSMNEEHIVMNEKLLHINQEVITALAAVEQTQRRLAQQEKLAGIGQLAAGVAHEINNPLGFVTGNVETLEGYFSAFGSVIAKYRELGRELASLKNTSIDERLDQVLIYEKEKEIDYILTDFPELFQDTLEGLGRMSKIVKGMRLFSHVNHQVVEEYNLIDGVETTLLVAQNEFKHYAIVEKSLAPIPTIEAFGSEINQVLLNIIVNAAQAIRARHDAGTGLIKISTWHDERFVYCAIRDNGIGITKENVNNIFNPFFTTKPVGQGTGMGLSISYDIIVNNHKGEILVDSIEGEGTKFTVKLPIKHEITSSS